MISDEVKEKANSGRTHWKDRASMVPGAVEHLENYFDSLEGIYLLDAGCAQGKHTAEFSQYGIESVGLEKEEKFVEEARENYPGLEFQVGDIEDMPYDEGTFDAVFCVNTLFYTDYGESLPELERVLKEGGIGIVTINEEIRNLDEDEIIHEADIDEVLGLLENSEVVSKEYRERVDEDPFKHRHKFWYVVYRKN